MRKTGLNGVNPVPLIILLCVAGVLFILVLLKSPVQREGICTSDGNILFTGL